LGQSTTKIRKEKEGRKGGKGRRKRNRLIKIYAILFLFLRYTIPEK
jgi:hypothetical protein